MTGRRRDRERRLLDHGAGVDALRSQRAWLLAWRGGFDGLTALVEDAGARPQPMTPADCLLAARGASLRWTESVT